MNTLHKYFGQLFSKTACHIPVTVIVDSLCNRYGLEPALELPPVANRYTHKTYSSLYYYLVKIVDTSESDPNLASFEVTKTATNLINNNNLTSGSYAHAITR